MHYYYKLPGIFGMNRGFMPERLGVPGVPAEVNGGGNNPNGEKRGGCDRDARSKGTDEVVLSS